MSNTGAICSADIHWCGSGPFSERIGIIPAMDNIGSGGIGLVVGLSIVVQLAWHLAVIVLVYKIWQKVKHLPE